ncbi:hypothetical protein D6827_04045, partial [Candidatus Parcubacteria bacterium]
QISSLASELSINLEMPSSIEISDADEEYFKRRESVGVKKYDFLPDLYKFYFSFFAFKKIQEYEQRFNLMKSVLSFKHLRRLERLKEKILRGVNKQRSYIAGRLFSRVDQELAHQRYQQRRAYYNYYDELSVDFEIDWHFEKFGIDTVYTHATNEEIRRLLYSSIAQFKLAGKDLKTGELRLVSYGGEPWIRIAKVAINLWKETTDVWEVVDSVFDLEHHHGGVFNYHLEKVDDISALLDLKNNAKDEAEFLNAVLENMYTSDRKELMDWQDNIEREMRIIEGIINRYSV